MFQDCFAKNTKLRGYEAYGGEWDGNSYEACPWSGCKVTTYTHATDLYECQKICQDIDDCKAFVFNEDSDPPTCKIKNTYDMELVEIGPEINKWRTTYGPKHCPGI